MKQRIIEELKKIDRSLRRLNLTLEYNKEMKHIYKNISTVPDFHHPSIKEAKQYWRKRNIRLNPMWNTFCASLNNIHSSKYIPENLFFNYITPSLNNFTLAWAYVDKNMYDLFMRGIKMPKTILRCMHGNLYDAGYHLLNLENVTNILPEKETDCFIKPSIISGSGRNIRKCSIKGGKIYIDGKIQNINELKSSYAGEFIIQEGVDQSPILSGIYPYCINCIRSLSFRYNGKIILMSHLLKFGNNRNYIDNTGAGGVVCGVDYQGKITEYAYDSKFNKIFEHPFTRKPFKETVLPGFDDLEKIIVQCHERLPYFDVIGWDFGVDCSNEYIMIEYNILYPGLNYHQVINGPIFEKYLDEIGF
jgi:hypothetical protein